MTGDKILITGSSGQLGSVLIDFLSNTVGYTRPELDLTDINKIKGKFKLENPTIVIHSAALTDVDYCEINKDEAYLINTIGTYNISKICMEMNIKLIYISSTGVYGNYQTDAYTEFDKVEPTTIHHDSKYQAELIIKQHLKDYVIIRTGWLYGRVGNKKNFIDKRIVEAKNNKIIQSDDMQIGNPTCINNLANQIEVILKNNLTGVFNCVDKAKNISRFEYIKYIYDILNINVELRKIPNGQFKRIAPVSFNESAVNYKLELMKLNIMKDWKDSLKDYLKKFNSFENNFN